MIKVLSIAGSDPSSGAGIQVDLKTFQALGAFGMAVPAALTVQNSNGVSGVEAVSTGVFSKQLQSLLSDIKPHAAKTGMLLTKQNVETTATLLKKFKIKNLVIDPVLKSTSGRVLLQPAAIKALRKKLFPLATIVTPNLPETELLSGMTIKSEKDMDYAAGKILDLGPSYVLDKRRPPKRPCSGHAVWRQNRNCVFHIAEKRRVSRHRVRAFLGNHGVHSPGITCGKGCGEGKTICGQDVDKSEASGKRKDQIFSVLKGVSRGGAENAEKPKEGKN